MRSYLSASLRVEQLADQIPFLGLAAAGKFLEPGDAAPAWRDVPVNLRHAPTAPIGGDDEIAGQRQLEPAAGANPVDGRDRDAGEIFDHLRGFLVLAALPIRVFVVPAQKVLDVVAGTEGIPGAAEYEKPAFAVLLHFANGVRKLIRHLAIKRVVGVRSVEGDPCDRCFPIEDDVLVL